MNVSISIVAYRNLKDIQRCLISLDRLTYKDFGVVICENGGLDAYEALRSVAPMTLSAGQKVTVISSPSNVGFAGGVNLCLKADPDADAWWILNPDTEPSQSSLENLVARLNGGDVDAVGCTLCLPNGKIQSYGGKWQPWLARAVSIGHSTSPDIRPAPQEIEKDQNYLNGAAMLVTPGFVTAAGLMREDYFLYCEEVEWCLRARDKGMRLGFAPNAEVLHYVGTTTGNEPNIRGRARMPIYLIERNRILLTRQRYPVRLPMVAVTAFLMLFAKYARRGAWRQLRYGMEGWWAGLKNEHGVPAWHSV